MAKYFNFHYFFPEIGEKNGAGVQVIWETKKRQNMFKAKNGNPSNNTSC